MASKISKFYREAAINLMSLNITDDSMFVILPSENDDKVYYRVYVNEETMQSERCSCRSYSYRQRCKHVQIVSDAFAGYSAPVAPTPEPVEDVEPVEPKITEIEFNNFYVVNSNTQVWRTEDGQWMAIGPTTNAIELVEAHLAVKEAERIVASPVEQPATRWDKDQCCQVYAVTSQPVDLVAQQAKLDKQRREYERGMLGAPLTKNSGFELLKVS